MGEREVVRHVLDVLVNGDGHSFAQCTVMGQPALFVNDWGRMPMGGLSGDAIVWQVGGVQGCVNLPCDIDTVAGEIVATLEGRL